MVRFLLIFYFSKCALIFLVSFYAPFIECAHEYMLKLLVSVGQESHEVFISNDDSDYRNPPYFMGSFQAHQTILSVWRLERSEKESLHYVLCFHKQLCVANIKINSISSKDWLQYRRRPVQMELWRLRQWVLSAQQNPSQ